MSEVITFLAAPPKDVDYGPSDGNDAVRTTEIMMQEAIAGGGLGYSARLERVTYVGDIARVLADLPEPPALIQIIGHGSPGRLQLGGYWGTSDDGRYECDVLDSSPDSYGVLEEKIQPSTALLLLGCSVGAASPGGYVASGRALLFDLEDMLGCHAYAADGLVFPSSFSDGFLYGGSLVTSSGKPANPVGALLQRRFRARPAEEPTAASPRVLTVTAIHSAVALGRTYATKVPSAIRLETTEDAPAGLFAMTEVEIETDHGPFEVVCAGTMLRTTRPGEKTLYYNFKEEGRVADNNQWLDRLSEVYLRGRAEATRSADDLVPSSSG